MRICGKKSFEKRIKVARYFAVVNSINDVSPGREIFSPGDIRDLMIPPKPALTGDEKPDQTDVDEKINLTIALLSTE